MKTVLTIAGFDPSSGAGVTADLMVFAAHGLFGTSCITALTVQSTLRVAATHPVSPEIARATLQHLEEDLPPMGIKIGMLGTAEMVAAVADFIEQTPGIPVVLDPVLRSSSGRELLSPDGVELMRTRLLPLVGWVTPNLDELGILVGERVTTREEMAVAGRRLRDSSRGLTVLATGGHLASPDDLLLAPDGDQLWLQGELIATSSTHGTGCALSSAVLSRLVLGDSFTAAALAAKEYVAGALRAAKGIGHGRGPIHHLWPLEKLEGSHKA
ncbi:bifunctional hydroxymethylpyrimidine kinase/phosphomethylpyrimidine kinase [Granulicella arctica]|uniref:hydroxymethylpyrimidine kinase n=1 Tax=Granulicella arctica TaxID=940613 RepID=A0A7Y9PIA8_9BACT|nr:bifunctional hydroxymethylpyrimidine kinase/phosphomethylpyrimidine kinase [Granulicella arctica]NYF80423.1 hydroxymethylpyrimidine/phosphomethylpyrimidine kinase [Granulicella arctica]